MSMTASTKDEFSTWMMKTVKESQSEIEDHDPAITFDVTGHLANMDAKDATLKGEVGKVAPLKAAAIKQVKIVKDLREDEYKAASALADAVSGHLGKNHPLSIIIHQKRESLSNPANRGPRKPKTEETSTDETPLTDTPTV